MNRALPPRRRRGMWRTMFRPFVVFPVLALVSGCVTVGGAPVGPAGSRPLAAGGNAGVLNGGIAGESVAALPREDRQRAAAAEFQALEFQSVGDPVEWRGRKGSGSVSALAPFQVGSQNCRRLVHNLVVDGENVIAKGSACRDPNGTWTPLT